MRTSIISLRSKINNNKAGRKQKNTKITQISDMFKTLKKQKTSTMFTRTI